MNFRVQTDPNFVVKTAVNPNTKKPETRYEIQNASGYGYSVVTPPCHALYPHLNEGGNEGGMFSKTKETSDIVTHLLRDSAGEPQFKSEREDFFAWLAKTNELCLDQMYDHDISGATTAIRAKTKKRYGKNKTDEELEEMSRRAFKKNALVPLKTNKEGQLNIKVKCKAYGKDLSPREIRYVREDYTLMDSSPQIRSGALLSAPFQIRPFAMSKDKYGLTYSLRPDIIVYSSGQGREAAPLEDIETPNRNYAMAVVEARDGKQYLNINDDQNRNFEFRPTGLTVVFGDQLTGNGNMGSIAGVNESSAKYTCLAKEDPADPNSVSVFDYMEKIQNDVFEHSFSHESYISKLKDMCKEEAQDFANETGESFDVCFKKIVKENFNGPVSKRESDNYRQVKFSQNVFTRSGTKNMIPMYSAEGTQISDDIQRGAKIAPVLFPKAYVMADGKFGLSFKISIQHGIRVDSNPEASNQGGGILYSFKRKAESDVEPASKRARSDGDE